MEDDDAIVMAETNIDYYLEDIMEHYDMISDLYERMNNNKDTFALDKMDLALVKVAMGLVKLELCKRGLRKIRFNEEMEESMGEEDRLPD